MKTGIELIVIERHEQLHKHGFSIQSDVENNSMMELSFAASLLCCPEPTRMGASPINNYGCPMGWDTKVWERMILKPYKDRLVIAGALCAAEIDRLNEIIQA